VGYLQRRGGLSFCVDDRPVEGARIWNTAPTCIDASFDGVRRRFDVERVGATTYVDSDLGASALVEVDRFPPPAASTAVGSLLAPMPGSVVRVLGAPGAPVEAGDTLVVLEAMKMEHAIRAPHGGIVSEVRVEVGQQVETGAVLVVVDADGS
jgi:biotin carboxyl carrier protein